MKTDENGTVVARSAVLVTLDEAAAKLGLSRYKLTKLFDAGEIAPRVKVGGCLRVPAADLQKYLRREKTRATRARQAASPKATEWPKGMDWMLVTKEDEERAAAAVCRFAPGDPNRLP